MTVFDRLLTPAHVADDLNDVKTPRLDIGAFHHDVAQAEYVHAHRPHFLLAAHDGDEGEAERVRAAVLGHRQPVPAAVREATVVDEHARATGAHDGRAGLH